MKINPFATFTPIEGKWLKGAGNGDDFLACPTCGYTVGVAADVVTQTFKSRNNPTETVQRKLCLEDGFVKTKSGIYKFPPHKKRLMNVPLSLIEKQLPAIADCPNPKCKRQIILRLRPMRK